MASKGTNLPVDAAAVHASLEEKQRRRMLVALALLLVALVVVLIKDRQFWFPSSASSEPTVAEQNPAPATSNPGTQSPAAAAIPSPPAATIPKSERVRTKKPGTHAPSQPADTQAAPGPVITATNRTVLPPLQVEVVAGNQHRPLSPKNNSVNVDMDSGASVLPPSPTPPPQNQVADASADVSLPPATAERVSRSVKPEYPLLAKEMKVQGAVVLQALIDKAGKIEELHVVSGPGILAAAAQEAVKQWRFKPYYQQGQAVETEARITVNFTISTY